MTFRLNPINLWLKFRTQLPLCNVFESFIVVSIIYLYVTFLEIEILSAFNILTASFCRIIFIITFFALYLPIFVIFRKKIISQIQQVRINLFSSVVISMNLLILFENVIFRPNNWDSMTYHLPRIEHWLQNGSVEFYSTNISRQNWSPPFGDFMSLIPHAIFGIDFFDSIFSYISLLILQISVYVILSRVSKNIYLVRLSFCLMLAPTVILESLTTQVDLRASALAISAVMLITSSSKHFRNLSILSLGLAAGIKIPAILSVLPIVLIIPIMRQGISRLKVIPFLIYTLLATIINIPWLLRNFQGYGSFFGEANTNDLQPGWAIIKLAINPILFLTRLLGVLYSNLGLPVFAEVNEYIFAPVKKIAEFLHLHSGTPSGSYWPDISTANFGINEDVAPNVVVALAFIGLFIYFVKRRLFYNAFLILTPILFFAFIVEWQIWINRLLITTIVSIIILSLCFIENLKIPIKPWLIKSIAVISLFVSFSFLLLSNDRGLLRVPLMTSNSQQDYFRQRLYLWSSYSNLSDTLKALKVKKLVLQTSSDSWEYPLWAMNPGVELLSGSNEKIPILCVDSCSAHITRNRFTSYDFGNDLNLYLPKN